MSSKILRYPEPYPVIFTVDYDTYMSALRQGKGHNRMKLFVDEEGKKFFRLELRKVSFNRDKVIYKTCQWYWNIRISKVLKALGNLIITKIVVLVNLPSF